MVRETNTLSPNTTNLTLVGIIAWFRRSSV